MLRTRRAEELGSEPAARGDLWVVRPSNIPVVTVESRAVHNDGSGG